MLRLQHQHETLTTWNFPLPLQCGIPRLYLWVCRHALSDALSSSIVLVHYPNTHTHTHTLCKAAFIRVVMPVKSKTDNWRVPGVYKNNKHKHEVCNNIRWHASIVFWCGFAGKLGCSRTQGSKGSKIKTILPCFVHPGREDV